MSFFFLTRQKANCLTNRFLPKTKQLFSLRCCISTTTNANPKDTYSSKEQTLMFLLKKCSTMNDLKQIHAHVMQSGFEQNLFVIGKVIVFCAASEKGDMNYAVSVFENVRNPDGFLWNTMIRGFGGINEPHQAFEYYNRMQSKGLVADDFTFSFLLKVVGKLGLVLLGKQMHCSVLKHGHESHVFVRNNLIHMYGLFKDIVMARQLFDEILDPDLVAWNTMITCYVHYSEFKEALDLFSMMLKFGTEPDETTLVVTLAACSAMGALDFGRLIHSCIDHCYLGRIIKVNNALIDMYAKCGAVEKAYETFHRMNKRNIVTWNTIISGLATHGHTNQALILCSEMLEQKLLEPDGITFLGVLCACSHGGMVEEGRRYFDKMIKEYHIKPTIKHYGCMVDMLSRAGFVEEAYGLIRSMPMECNAILWRTLLASCRLHGNVELGEKVRKHLLELVPDHSSDYVLLSNIYASVGEWNEVDRLRKSMQKRRVQKPEPGNSFIGIHSNARDLDRLNVNPLVRNFL